MRIYKTLPELTKRKQLSLWHKALRIDWSPADIDYDSGAKFSRESHRRHLARALSPILMGEQAGLYSITSIIRILGQTSEVEGQFFLTSMALDEAKHCEVFAHYYRRLGHDPLSIRRFPSGYLFQSAIVSDDPIVWLTGSLVSEVLAKHSLMAVRDQHIDPVLDEMCDRILEDETRHLGFNHVFLADRFSSAYERDPADADETAERLHERLEAVLDRVPDILKDLAPDMHELGLPTPDDFFEKMREECRTRLSKSVDTGRRDWQKASLAEAVEAE